MSKTYCAHSVEGQPQEAWEPLLDHLSRRLSRPPVSLRHFPAASMPASRAEAWPRCRNSLMVSPV